MTGEEIKAWRKSLGLTQAEFAVHILGVTAATLRRWELGHTVPSPMAQKLIKEVYAGIKIGRSQMEHTEQLETQIRLVAELRATAQKASEAKIAARVAWENEHKDILDLATFTAKNVEEAEAVLRQLTLQVYSETGNKAPAVGVGIREITKLEYDTKLAFGWAREHELALRLDVSAFEKIAKVDPMAFVRIYQEPQATIASVL